MYDLIIRVNKSQLKDLLYFFHNIADNIPQDFQEELHDLFQTLRRIFENLIQAFPPTKVSSALSAPVQRKISSRDVSRIKAGVKELEEWNDRFLKRVIVFLFLGDNNRPTSSERERALAGYAALDHVNSLRRAVQATLSTASSPKKLLLEADDDIIAREPLPYSSIWMIKRAPDARPCLVEDRQYSDDADATSINAIRKTVRDIASILHEADPDAMGVLQCRGFRQEPSQNRFELHFDFPPDGHRPHSLRDLLRAPINQKVGIAHPLNHRINLAKRLASAVFYIHSGDFVHKNIRPDNILIFEPTFTSNLDPKQAKYHQYPRALGTPFLVGYDGVRKVDAVSQRLLVKNWKKNIYLNPERHRLQVGDEFTMQHDVYSLGVVLLEIALWTDFTDRKSGFGKRLWQDHDTIRSPTQLQQLFIDAAKVDIPRALGQKYSDAVVACLTGLKAEKDAGILKDQDDVVVGLAFITQVVRKLEEISV